MTHKTLREKAFRRKRAGQAAWVLANIAIPQIPTRLADDWKQR